MAQTGHRLPFSARTSTASTASTRPPARRKYAYDITPAEHACTPGCSAARTPTAKITSLDLSPAEKVPGVVAVMAMKEVGNEIRWQGDQIAVVAAETEGAAAEGLAAIKVEYEVLAAFVNDTDRRSRQGRRATPASRPKTFSSKKSRATTTTKTKFNDAEIERLFKESAVVVEGRLRHPQPSRTCASSRTAAPASGTATS